MDNHDEPNHYAEYQLSCAEALVAGTLALMTGHAQTHDDSQRQFMTCKIRANLSQLAQHTCISTQFRMMLGNLQTHWQMLQMREAGHAENAELSGTHPARGTLH